MNINYIHPADQLVMFMQRIYDKGLTTTSGGNLSIMDNEGNIFCGGLYYELHRVMIANSERSVFLIDSEKRDHRPTKVLCNFGNVSAVVSDYDFSYLQSQFPETQLLTVEL